MKFSWTFAYTSPLSQPTTHELLGAPLGKSQHTWTLLKEQSTRATVGYSLASNKPNGSKTINLKF